MSIINNHNLRNLLEFENEVEKCPELLKEISTGNLAAIKAYLELGGAKVYSISITDNPE